MGVLERVAEELSKRTSERIAVQAVRVFQRMKPSGLAGDDEGFINVWDEICVQVQGEHSFYWEAYEDTIDQVLNELVDRLAAYEKAAIWCQTEEYCDWILEPVMSQQDQLELFPDVVHQKHTEDLIWVKFDIIRHLRNKFVLPKAMEWTNRRIRNYDDTRYSYEDHG